MLEGGTDPLNEALAGDCTDYYIDYGCLIRSRQPAEPPSSEPMYLKHGGEVCRYSCLAKKMVLVRAAVTGEE